MFEAIACENPFPARYFPELNFNQMVLKALFNGVALARIVGLRRRRNPELARMAARLRRRTARRRPARAGRHRLADQWQRRLPMKLFDPHIHMTSRTTDDYEAMAAAGIAAIVEPAFWLGQPRTHVGSVRGLLPRPARLGALPREPVRHPALLHDRAQPEGSEQPASSPTA